MGFCQGDPEVAIKDGATMIRQKRMAWNENLK
jgi:hypothetical protein